MSVNHAETITVTCPACKMVFETQVWITVDAAAAPNLAARCCDGTIHRIGCACGSVVPVDAPILV